MPFINALRNQNFGPPPIWLMRQAGRFLPSYHAFKEKQTLLEMFHDPDTIVKVTKLPFNELDLDAAILFSDILTVLDGLSVPYTFQPGPVVNYTSFQKKENAYAHITEAITTLKKELSVPLIGFAGGPFTVLSYVLSNAKKMLFEDPKQFYTLLEQIVEETVHYLDVQVDAGVDAIQIFDSWADQLAIHDFRHVILPYMRRIVNHVTVPTILFCRHSAFFAEDLANCHPAAISIDWSGDLPAIRKKLPGIALQGNLDPHVLYGSQEAIRSVVDPLIEQMAGDPGFIFNLGHGVLPDIPLKNVQFLVNYVKDRSRELTEV